MKSLLTNRDVHNAHPPIFSGLPTAMLTLLALASLCISIQHALTGSLFEGVIVLGCSTLSLTLAQVFRLVPARLA